ncbi:MAG: ABC transporter ATP-binding protein [Streptosporangiaceae bacterium]
MSASSPVLMEISGLSVSYGTGPRGVRAVDDVSLPIRQGEAVGLAGESGSGKSTLALAVARLLRPPAVVGAGRVTYHPPAGGGQMPPVEVLSLDKRALRRFRWQEVAVVLQSAMNALNPVLSLRAQLTDVIATHQPGLSRSEQTLRARELLETVGVSPDRLKAYPHELSGGMRQRAMIAMALALRPRLIIMDEPTTALDVVTQRQILEELASLRKQFGFAMLFITHDLSLLLEMADTIAVMYAGRLVEYAAAEQIYARPAHPYTAGLLRSFPPLSGPRRTLEGIPGSPPSLRDLPPGCPFRPRCSRAAADCAITRPDLTAPAAGGGSGRLAACLHDLTVADSQEALS